jgi:hypothetical protein
LKLTGLDNTRTSNPAEELWHQHAPPLYPSGVLPVPWPIIGTAFFPGGFGLWNPNKQYPLPEFPVGKVMVVGHDFHSEVGYSESLSRGAESDNQPTWRNLRKLFSLAGIALEDCFFTNIYMGLRAGAETTGVFPGASDPEFVSHCLTFMAKQLVEQRPRLIITLGVNVPAVLASLSTELSEIWGKAHRLSSLNDEAAVVSPIRFADIPGYSTTAVALIHPSLRDASLRHRAYNGLIGNDAEIRMLRDAIEFSRRELTNTR